MVIQNNIPAMNAGRYLGVNTGLLGSSLEKLSSGYKINRAGDNAAGLAVSEKMRSQMSGIDQAIRNAGDGISMIQTFEGALTESHSILNRIKALAAQAANGTYTDETDRAAIELEYNQLVQELDDISQTDFNGVIVMAKGGTVLRGRTEKRTVHHDAEMTPGAGVNASATGLDKLSADETVNVTAGSAEVTAQQARYSATIRSGVYAHLTPLNEEWDLSFAVNMPSGTTFTVNSGASVTINGKTLNVTAGNYTLTQFLTYVQNNISTFDIDPTKYDFSFSSQFSFGNIKGMQLIIEAKNDGTGSALSLPSTFTTTGIPEFSSGGFNLVQKGRDESDNTFKLFGYDITLANGDGIDQIVTKLQTAIGSDGYTASKANATTISLEKNTAGVDSNAAARKQIDAADPNGMVIDNIIVEYGGRDYAAAVTPTITTSGWALQTDGRYKKGDTYITLGATTGGGSITLKAAYDALEDVYVPASVVNADSVSLQVGSRTKDLKKYDFTYSQVWNTMTNPAGAQASSIGALVADVSVTAAGLGLVTATVNLASQSNANTALDKIDNAINKVSMIRSTFGSIQNRLDHKIDNLGVTNENINAAESRIRDTDMASEMMLFTKKQIILQASQSMLAQANQLPAGTLQLLQ